MSGSPPGRFLLVRKGLQHCALTFIETWVGEAPKDPYARYKFYYQGDGSGDFSKGNVKYEGREIHFRTVNWGGFHCAIGDPDVRCGPMRLVWASDFGTIVCFYSDDQKPHDSGIELAPTKWTDISEVTIYNPSLKWYRYDKRRKPFYPAIDQLW